MIKPHLSIIIPFRRAERDIFSRMLLQLDHALTSFHEPYEVIIVEEDVRLESESFSSDFMRLFKKTQWFENDTIRGVGDLFRQGMLKAKGKFRLFLEPAAFPAFQEINEALAACTTGSEIVIAHHSLQTLRFETQHPFTFRVLFFLRAIISYVSYFVFHYDSGSGFLLLSETAAERIIPRMRLRGNGFIRELVILGERVGFGFISLALPWKPFLKPSFRRELQSLFQSFQVHLWIKKGKYD